MMGNAITPLVYGLPIDKSAQDYKLYLEKVLEQDNFQPDTSKSVKDMLPNVLHKGMF